MAWRGRGRGRGRGRNPIEPSFFRYEDNPIPEPDGPYPDWFRVPSPMNVDHSDLVALHTSLLSQLHGSIFKRSVPIPRGTQCKARGNVPSGVSFRGVSDRVEGSAGTASSTSMPEKKTTSREKSAWSHAHPLYSIQTPSQEEIDFLKHVPNDPRLFPPELLTQEFKPRRPSRSRRSVDARLEILAAREQQEKMSAHGSISSSGLMTGDDVPSTQGGSSSGPSIGDASAMDDPPMLAGEEETEDVDADDYETGDYFDDDEDEYAGGDDDGGDDDPSF